MALNSEIFVDKTGMIRYLNSIVNTNQRYVSVSRPRRFGKTTAADMLCAYYDRTADSREMFEKLKVSCTASKTADPGNGAVLPWDAYLGKFNVIRVVMTDFLDADSPAEEMLGYMTEEITAELMECYPDIRYGKRISLHTVMSKIYASTRIAFVVIIDEWDALFRTRKKDKESQTAYLNFLRDGLKDKEYIALAYMTGILPIKKYGEHSALNMFSEYSMVAPMQLAPYTGFTEEEVKGLCERYGRDYERIKDWYDGYLVYDIIPPAPKNPAMGGPGTGLAGHRYSLYSPLSVVNALMTGYIMNYWNNTESYEALAEYIRRDYDGLQDTVALLMDGGRTRVELSSYQNDMTTFHGRDDVLALLIHLGYLGYDGRTGEVFIPNKEILDVFRTSTKVDPSGLWKETFKAYEDSQKLLEATWACDEEKVAALLEKAHDRAAKAGTPSFKRHSCRIEKA